MSWLSENLGKALDYYSADHVIIITEKGFETYNVKKFPLKLWEADC